MKNFGKRDLFENLHQIIMDNTTVEVGNKMVTVGRILATGPGRPDGPKTISQEESDISQTISENLKGEFWTVTSMLMTDVWDQMC